MEKEKREEKQPIPWEAVDPKPPIIRSGHMENRKIYCEAIKIPIYRAV